MNRCNLVLHCGASKVDRVELGSIPTPSETPSWRPIPHEGLLDAVESRLSNHGLEVVSEAHAVSHDGHRYFGLLQISQGDPDADFGWVVGLRNSHDKTLPAGLVAGNAVFVCDNLAFIGEIKVTRKHTPNITRDLVPMVDDAISGLIGLLSDQDTRIKCYRESYISDADAHDLTVRALDAGAITTRMIPGVLQEWRQPRHDAFAERSLWSWFNACTELMKGRLHYLPQRSSALFGVCDRFIGKTIERSPDALSVAV